MALTEKKNYKFWLADTGDIEFKHVVKRPIFDQNFESVYVAFCTMRILENKSALCENSAHFQCEKQRKIAKMRK